MFDYHYGTSTKKFRQDIDAMKPKLEISKSSSARTISEIFKYCHGLDIVTLCLVSKLWYAASWCSGLWEELAYSIGNSDRIQVLIELSESKLRTYERRLKKNDLSELFPNEDIRETLRWKFVYGQLLYNTCCECGVQESKLRFLPILQLSICFPCAKLPKYSMISLENVEIEYHLSRKQINESQIEGLRVPDPNEAGKQMFVYYVTDIVRLKKRLEAESREDSQVKNELQERRRTEMVYIMKKEGFDDDFIYMCLDTEGSLAHNYVMGKSKMPAGKIVKKLFSKYEKWKDTEQDDEPLPEPEAIFPLKKPRMALNAEERLKRKQELVERLLVMGVSSDDIGLEDPDSIANAYIEGRTKEDLGPVAGSIWRDHRPVFNGVSFRKLYAEKYSKEINSF